MRTNRPLLLLLALTATALALTSAGCGRRRVRGDVVTSGGDSRGVQVGGGGIVAHGSPREMLDQYDQVMRQASYGPVGPVTAASLPPNGMTAYALDVRRGYCYTLAVFGPPGSDVNLVVLDPLGRDIGHDVHPDGHPWASFCAARGGRFVARVQMVTGGGEIFFAPYMARARQPADLASFFGTAEAQAQVAAIDGDTMQRLTQLDSQMQGERFARVGDPAGLVLRNREERLFQLALEQGRCYAFATLGGPGTTDTDVYLVDGSGQRLQADTSTSRDAVVRYCSSQTANYTLQVRVFGGEGSVFTVGYVQAAEGQATAVVAEDAAPVIAQTSTAGAALDENFALLDADMRARGYETLSTSQRGELAEGASQDFGVDLEGGRCYAILAVGDSGVREMSLSLLDGAGQEVDRDDFSGSRPTVRVCPLATGHYEMRVRIASGNGRFVYAPYRWPRGTSLGDLRGLVYVRLAEVTALLNVEEYQPDAGYSIENGRLAREGAESTQTLTLQGGQCYAVVVVGGDGVRDIDVSLSHSGTEIANDFGVRNAFPSVRHCATETGPYQIRVRAASGAGPYIYQVFSRSGSGG